jgi:hypothetical protein
MTELSFQGFLIFTISLVILLTVQRLLHRELQAVFLLLTQRPSLAIGLFSLILFPGVFIHEFSHWLMAVILRVPVRNVSLLPQTQKDGKLRLGFVETRQTDYFRDSMIGLAPFISGIIITALIGLYRLNLFPLIDAIMQFNLDLFSTLLLKLPQEPDFGIWFYLGFAVSSTMIPSESDRQSWGGLFLGIGVVLVLVLVTGLGDWMLLNFAPILNRWLLSIGIILSASVLIHLILLIPTFLLVILFSRILGLRVV